MCWFTGSEPLWTKGHSPRPVAATCVRQLQSAVSLANSTRARAVQAAWEDAAASEALAVLVAVAVSVALGPLDQSAASLCATPWFLQC